MATNTVQTRWRELSEIEFEEIQDLNWKQKLIEKHENLF